MARACRIHHWLLNYWVFDMKKEKPSKRIRKIFQEVNPDKKVHYAAPFLEILNILDDFEDRLKILEEKSL